MKLFCLGREGRHLRQVDQQPFTYLAANTGAGALSFFVETLHNRLDLYLHAMHTSRRANHAMQAVYAL